MAELTMKQIYTEADTDDPYPLFRRIRETDPVYWDPHMGDGGAWMVTGYTEAMTALMDTRLSAKRPQWNPAVLPETTEPAHRTALAALDSQVVVADPPSHTRLRRHLNRPFLPRPVHDMEDRIAKIAGHLIDRALSHGTGEFDAMGDYGFTLPATSLGRVLGIPRDQDYIPWMLSLGQLIDDGPVSRERTPKLLGSVHEYLEFFRGQVSERRDGGYDDMMQTLADAYTDGEFADETELHANLAFLLTAGQISTAHQIGSTLLHLLRRPEIYERLRADPSLVSAVSPELMRYDASVQLTKRRVREPLRLGEHDLGTGQEIYVWIGAANRDPARFPDPDRLDPDRENVTHLSFGRGIHFCLGAQLGKLVHDTAVRTFLDRVPSPRLLVDGRVHRSAMPTFRGPYLLPVGYR